MRAAQAILRSWETSEGETVLLNPTLNTDGIFGTATEKAVRIVQEDQRLYGYAPLNGQVDMTTWCVLLGGDVQHARGCSGKWAHPS